MKRHTITTISGTQFKTLICLVFVISFLISVNAKAADNNQDAINQQYWITRQQQNIFDTISKEHERKEKEDEELKKFKIRWLKPAEVLTLFG